MNLLSIENITKKYSEKELLNDISLGINEGDKIGVIGINGTGKSTLLKIIAEVEYPDDGRVIKGSSINIEYLPQNPYFDPEATVLEQVFKGESPLMNLMREYKKALSNPETSSSKIIDLSQRMDALNAWDLESEAKGILTKLGISQFNDQVGTLSGGQRKRIALASALIQPCDLLILDEPTNHLDNQAIDWLEDYLNRRKGALLMITHDRYFLDRVVNQIIEISKGSLYLYKGNYSYFLERKMEHQEREKASERKRQSILKKELAWIRRGARARSTKQKSRIQRFEQLNEKETDLSEDKLEMALASSRLGKKVVELKEVSKSFPELTVIKNFSYTLMRDDRVGIVGANGMGKSTLINLISKKLEPDHGEVQVGETVKIGLFSQETDEINPELRVIEYIREGAEYIATAQGDRISAAQMLEKFLFPPQTQWTLISKLSGGEKRRLQLLRVLMEAPNVLLLDEPTNDLDIDTLRILEDYIEGFQGAVVAVSHDRYFLDKIADKIFAFEGHGEIVQYTGNYSHFKQEALEKERVSDSQDNFKTPEKKHPRTKERTLKFSYNEQREYEEIDDIIADLENKIKGVEESLAEASTDYTLLQELMTEKEELEGQLEQKMERWIYLNDFAERIEKNK